MSRTMVKVHSPEQKDQETKVGENLTEQEARSYARQLRAYVEKKGADCTGRTVYALAQLRAEIENLDIHLEYDD